jgi:hypothetical protein
MQTRSQTLRQRGSACFAEMKVLLSNITGKGLERAKQIQAFMFFVDKNVELIKTTLPVANLEMLKITIRQARTTIEMGKASMLTFLSKNERAEFVRLIYKLDSKLLPK